MMVIDPRCKPSLKMRIIKEVLFISIKMWIQVVSRFLKFVLGPADKHSNLQKVKIKIVTSPFFRINYNLLTIFLKYYRRLRLL